MDTMTLPVQHRAAGQFETVTRSAGGARAAYTFVCSTGGKKWDGFSLRPDGWRLDAYHRLGGPVLWQHDHKRPPIGRAKAYRAGNALKADVTFDATDPFAELVRGKVENGFVRQISVGWDFVSPTTGEPLSHRHVSTDYLERSANYRLNELSVVTVGADPDALVELSRAAAARTVIDLAPRVPSRPLTRAEQRAGQQLLGVLDEHVTVSRISRIEAAIRSVDAETADAIGSYAREIYGRSYGGPSRNRGGASWIDSSEAALIIDAFEDRL